MLHQNNIFTANDGFDFVNNPTIIETTAKVNLNISAVGSGRSIGAKGTRLWDTNIHPANLVVAVSPAQPFVAPLVKEYLPANLFDAIIVLSVNGELTPIGVSNSNIDKNTYIGTEAVDRNLFWINLNCFGLGNQVGNSSTDNHYMFGGTGKQVNSELDLILYLDSVLTTNLEVTYSVQYYTYNSGVFGLEFKDTVILDTGKLQYTLMSFNPASQNYNAGFGSLMDSPGYFKINVSTNDKRYRSLLPEYNWGLG